MILYFCPESAAWSHQECNCPGSKDDDKHSAYMIDKPEAAVATLINLLHDVYDDLNDLEDKQTVTMERIADVYLELTGNLI